MRDTVRTYAQFGLGVAEVALTRVATLVRDLAEQAPGMAARSSAGENREGPEVGDTAPAAAAEGEDLAALIRREIDLAIGRLGLVREEEIAALRRHLRRLEEGVAELAEAASSGAPGRAAAPEPAEPEPAELEPAQPAEPEPAQPAEPEPAQPAEPEPAQAPEPEAAAPDVPPADGPLRKAPPDETEDGEPDRA